jgi:hypothetical protein
MERRLAAVLAALLAAEVVGDCWLIGAGTENSERQA